MNREERCHGALGHLRGSPPDRTTHLDTDDADFIAAQLIADYGAAVLDEDRDRCEEVLDAQWEVEKYARHNSYGAPWHPWDEADWRLNMVGKSTVSHRYLEAALNDLASLISSLIEENEVLASEFSRELEQLREGVARGEQGAFEIMLLIARLAAHPLADPPACSRLLAALTLRRLPERELLQRALLILRRGILQMRQREGVTAGEIWSESHELSSAHAAFDALYGEPPLPSSAIEIEARLRLLCEDLMTVAAAECLEAERRLEAATVARDLCHVLNRRS